MHLRGMNSPNMSPRLLLCAVLALYHGTQTCSGFNIDERFPVIKEGKTKGSFFGFSVALHLQGSRKYLLLAGAPKEKANSLPNVNETGAVYSCPITTDTNDCSRMDLVSTTDPSEMVEGMWLGVTVASQRDLPDGRVLACGHRYVKVIRGGLEEQRRMTGKCFVRSNDLTYDPDDEWQKNPYEFCNPGFGIELEGMCSMGISGGMTDTDVYIGATGSFLWQGNVHLRWRDPDPLNTWDSTDKDFDQLKRRYNYIGYSVLEEKKLLSRDEHTVVAGSPRDESKGSVTFGRKTDRKPGLEPVLIIPGEQVGSYFGGSLAATDLNNDDWNDLIVGAPFYFDRMKDQGGAVYIFMNENGSFQKTATVVLKGPSGSAFGIAVAAIGDVNQDGFQDFAVGAPFHDTGKVYIWMGSKKGISQEPSQVIEGKSVGGGGFHTFGYSITGGVDMDDNSYPDILVGSLDDRMALLRARPVLHLTTNFTVKPDIVDSNQCVSDKPCITATLCMSFTPSNGNKDFKKNATVNYTVEADVMRIRSPRVRFMDNSDDTYSGLLSLPSSKTKCHTLELFVVTPVRDKLEPVVFNLTMSLHEQKPKSRRSLQNLDSFPIVSQKQKLTDKTEIQFQKECGTDNKCSSNLQLKAQFVDREEKPYPRQGKSQILQFNSNMKIIRLMVEVTNFPMGGKLAEDAHQAVLNVTIPDALSYSGVRSTDHDVQCTLNDTVICDLGNPLKGNEKVSLTLKFETSGINLNTEEIESQLLLSTLSEQSDLKPVPVSLLIENTILPSFSIVNSLVKTEFGGTVMGESAMVNTSDVGSLVEFTFNVNMRGQPLGDMGTLAVEFEWPFEVANGKWLLYLTKIVVKGESETECNPPGGVVNQRNLTLSGSEHKRTKRQIVVDDADDTAKPQAAITLLNPRKETYLLECSKGTARCVTFTCPLLNMTSSAKIYVRSRLWNSTMLEDYPNALRITVKGQATLKLIKEKSTIKMDEQLNMFTVEIEPVERVEAPYELPLWIIISAAVAGILLLGIIILILWKCGFFQRANRREMYEAKAQKAEMKIQPSETERLTEDY
ncbi:integrin alpha-3b [Plectropomus leopardus]|uniref:integrin alpha-3b n=1 Tax=Plectropomus leopardus TaxID=160734 RepID=UPI001C4AFD49|nr:integrin alpha-3b [Plectropomus leopardus]